jgi:hypothetical protein
MKTINYINTKVACNNDKRTNKTNRAIKNTKKEIKGAYRNKAINSQKGQERIAKTTSNKTMTTKKESATKRSKLVRMHDGNLEGVDGDEDQR